MAEIRMPRQEGSDLTWIGRSLDAACRRLRGVDCPQIVSAGYSPEEGRLVCVVQAASSDDVRRLFEIALLPSVRIFEAVEVGRAGIEREPDNVRLLPPVPPSSRSEPES
jgi:hypothetical protein